MTKTNDLGILQIISIKKHDTVKEKETVIFIP